MSKFSMNGRIRKQIEKRGLYTITTERMSSIPKITLILGIVALVVGGIWLLVAGYPTESDEFMEIAGLFGIPGVLLFLNGFFDLIISRRRVAARKKGLELLELQYDRSAKEILGEIDEQIRTQKKDIPATEGFDSKKRGFIVKDWYIAPEFTRFVKLKDIACVASMDTSSTKALTARGTYIITTMHEDDAINDFFGGSANWKIIFDMIKQANPNVLTHHDKINLRGKETTIFEALRFVTSDTPLAEDSPKLTRERREIMDIVIAAFLKSHDDSVIS